MTDTKLTLVKPQPNPNANIVLYGLPGSGKTVAAASAPKPMLYVNSEAPNATRFAHTKYEFDEVRVEGLETLDQIEDVASEYATVVLDTVGETYRILLEQASDGAIRPHLSKYGDAGTYLERHIRALFEMPVNAVVVCHEVAVKDEDSGTLERLPFTTTNTGSPLFAAKLMAAADVVGYVGVVEREGQEPTYVAQLINGGGRRGKDRFGVLGTSRELDLEEWIGLAREVTVPKNDTKERAA